VTAAHLVVFQQDGTLASRDFTTKALPRLRELAAGRGITLDLRDARAGAPDEVHATPLLVYQDAFGRSIFRGRYTDLDRVGQFLRTVKAGPLANATRKSENTAAWRRGRVIVMAPIKITPLTGRSPDATTSRRSMSGRAARSLRVQPLPPRAPRRHRPLGPVVLHGFPPLPRPRREAARVHGDLFGLRLRRAGVPAIR